jgi:hypothetical protein
MSRPRATNHGATPPHYQEPHQGVNSTDVVATSMVPAKLVETLGITRLSKSQVSVMARELDEHVTDFRSRPRTRARTRS